MRDPGPENEEQVSPWARPQLNHVACLSLFTDASEPFPEEPKPVEMPSHHCHRDPLPQPGLTPERLQAQRQLCAACAVCCVFMAGEVVGKLESSSSNRVLLQPASATLHAESQGCSRVEIQRRWGWLARRSWVLKIPGVGEGEGQRAPGGVQTGLLKAEFPCY